MTRGHTSSFFLSKKYIVCYGQLDNGIVVAEVKMDESNPDSALAFASHLNDVDSSVTLDLMNKQQTDDSPSVIIQSQVDKESSFQFGSSTALADDNQAVYFVLEPSADSEGSFSKKQEVETCQVVQAQTLESSGIKMPSGLNPENFGNF